MDSNRKDFHAYPQQGQRWGVLAKTKKKATDFPGTEVLGKKSLISATMRGTVVRTGKARALLWSETHGSEKAPVCRVSRKWVLSGTWRTRPPTFWSSVLWTWRPCVSARRLWWTGCVAAGPTLRFCTDATGSPGLPHHQIPTLSWSLMHTKNSNSSRKRCSFQFDYMGLKPNRCVDWNCSKQKDYF